MKKVFIYGSIVLIMIMTLYYSSKSNFIDIENIKIKLNGLPNELNGIKIAHISDIHLPKNIISIDNIIDKVRQQKPDIIVISGDIVWRHANIKNSGLDILCEKLSQIANTYAVTGNHELQNKDLAEWENILKANNIKVIDNKIEIYMKNNKSIAIAGLKNGYRYDTKFFKNIESVKDLPMILLAHRPDLFGSYSSKSNSISPDIVFAGHAHGGQFRIPFINKGIIAPNQGLFPTYTSGLYELNNVKMVVSRGLGDGTIPLRMNNSYHIPIIELVKE